MFDKKEIITFVLLVAMFAISFAVLPYLPSKIPMHWNAAGQVDGFGSPDSIFILPLAALAVYALFWLIPKVAVHKKNILEFYKMHGFGFRLVFVLFMAAIQLMILTASFGKPLEMNVVMPILMGGLFFYLGYIMKDIKRNYFIGIRTPWSLASDSNWNKTHKFGGKMFMLAGALAAFVGLLGFSIWWMLAAILIPIAASVYYSYHEFRRTK